MSRFPNVAESSRFVSHRVFFAPLAERLKTLSEPPLPLHIGDTWRDPLPGARAEAQRVADHAGLHRYAPIQGEPALLDAIEARLAERAGRPVARANIQVTAGATGALNAACQALLDPGDEVLLPAPFWPLIRGIVSSRGAHAVQIPFFDRLAAIDVEATLEAAVTERTAAIYLNSPHNPTGAVLDDATVAAVARVAARNNLWVLCDEVYEHLWMTDAGPYAPIWAHPAMAPRAIAVHSMSKAYGLAGARVGYMHGPSAAMQAIRSVHTFQVYCAARPMQLGAAVALNDGDAWLAETRAAYRDAAERTAARLGLPCPAGGTFLFFDAAPYLAPGADDALPFLLRCLDAGVLLTPGGASGDDYKRFVRLCFSSVAPDRLDDAVARLALIMEASP